MNRADFRRDLIQRKWDRRRQRNQIREALSGARSAMFRDSRGWSIIIHRSTKPNAPTSWQLSTIAPDGPWGHNNPPSFLEGAFRAAGCSTDSYWNESGYTLAEVVR